MASYQLWADYTLLLLSCLSHYYCFGSVLQQPSLYPNTQGAYASKYLQRTQSKSTSDEKRLRIPSVGKYVEKLESSENGGGNVEWNSHNLGVSKKS